MAKYQASVVIIGDEVLQGETADVNFAFIAKALNAHGITIRRGYIIPDNHKVIVETIQNCLLESDYVFTTGGIGPTHDDITTDAVAAALGVEVVENPQAIAMMQQLRATLPPLARRMARIPVGATLIHNAISGAPGYQCGKVIVLAGVPSIMREMLGNHLPTLPKGEIVLAKSLFVQVGESVIGKILQEVENSSPGVNIGSYPGMLESKPKVKIVVRSYEQKNVDAAITALQKAFDAAQIQWAEREL